MKRLFTLLFATILAIQGFAQAYKFKLRQFENNSDYWEAQLDDPIQISEKKYFSMRPSSSRNKTVVFDFYLSDMDIDPMFLSMLIKEGELGTVQLYLDNGEILTTSEAHRSKFFIVLSAHTFKGQKNTHLNDTGGDAMKLLRNHNITKIRVQGQDYTTPGLRSAATIDAMCKALISKTGDQGQYGSAPSGGSTSSSTTNRPSTSSTNRSTRTSNALKDFFPLWGVTLGQTTWKQAEALGAEVKNVTGSRVANINKVAFWDLDATGCFTSIYWTCWEADFPSSWKAKGFSWDNSYDTWISTFRRMGYSISIQKSPTTETYEGRRTLSAKFTATSPDGSLSFFLEFNYGDKGHYTYSLKSLYSITIDYK